MYSWQYNGVAPWTDIADWCRDKYTVDLVYISFKFETIYFQRKSDYVLFLLRWA